VAVLPAFLKIESNQYILGRQIGRGGMSLVYEVELVEDARLPEPVVEAAQNARFMIIKVLNGTLYFLICVDCR
jgi:hypothetical protein